MTALEVATHDDADPNARATLRFLLGREERDWVRLAACRGMDMETFFPTRGQSSGPAKDTCARCVVREDCLDEALTMNERFGIWGGKSERQRRRIRRELNHKEPNGGCID